MSVVCNVVADEPMLTCRFASALGAGLSPIGIWKNKVWSPGPARNAGRQQRVQTGRGGACFFKTYLIRGLGSPPSSRLHAGVAQLAEPGIRNAVVVGSIPAASSIFSISIPM